MPPQIIFSLQLYTHYESGFRCSYLGVAINSPQLFDVEDAEGNQVMSGVTVAEIYQSLPSGEYSINGFPFYK